MNSKPISIAFEGMHRSGKGTQIKMLREFLGSLGFSTEVLRGAGSRKGTNLLSTEYYDPVDDYWLEFTRNRSENLENWIDSAYKINLEIFHFIQVLNVDIILMDRSYISNNFLLTLLGQNIIINNYVPDIVYYLKAEKKVLIDRVFHDRSSKKDFRLNNINDNYDKFTSYISDMSDVTNLVNIDAELPILKVHEIIKQDLCIRIKKILEER